jgi:hypothetical protein
MIIVISIAMGPTGGLFATGSGDMKARVWRVSRPQPPPQALPAPVPTHAPIASPPHGAANASAPAAAKSLSPKSTTNAQHTLAPVLSLPVMKKPQSAENVDSGPKSATSPTAKAVSPQNPTRPASPPAPVNAAKPVADQDQDMDD